MPPFVSLLIVLLVVGVIVFAMIALLLADSLLHPPRMNDGKALYLYQRLSPADLNLPFSEVTFQIPSIEQPGKSIDIAGWWIEAASPSDRCIVLLHGYADAKISVIGWAAVCRSMGFNILAIDLRAHGESGGRACTAGVREGADVTAVLAQLQVRFLKQTNQLVLFGSSMGATVALAAAVERSDLAGVIIESPYESFEATSRRSADLRGMPSGALFTAALWLAQRWVKIDYGSVRTSRLLPKLESPALWLHGTADRIVGNTQVKAIEEAMRLRNNVRDRMVAIADGDHLLGVITPEEVAAGEIKNFLDSVIAGVIGVDVATARSSSGTM